MAEKTSQRDMLTLSCPKCKEIVFNGTMAGSIAREMILVCNNCNWEGTWDDINEERHLDESKGKESTWGKIKINSKFWLVLIGFYALGFIFGYVLIPLMLNALIPGLNFDISLLSITPGEIAVLAGGLFILLAGAYVTGNGKRGH